MRIRMSLLLLVCWVLSAPALEAQRDFPGLFPEPPRSSPARFALSPAGPRALGLGGAFVAVADDPTAADANPAGLSQLERPQVLVSLRYASFDTDFVGGFSFARGSTTESVGGPAFVGYVQPLGRAHLAAYYQQDARFASGVRFELPRIIFDDPVLRITVPFIGFDERRYDQRLETVGLAAGARLNPVVSLGGAVRYQRLSLEWEDELGFEFGPIIAPPDVAPPLGFGYRAAADGDDSDLTLALGLLVHPEGRWTGGLSFQQGGEFGVGGSAGLTGFAVPAFLVPFDLRLDLPDVVAAGAAYRPDERWLVSAQVSHLTYSGLDGAPRFSALAGDLRSEIRPLALFRGDEPVDDEFELHLGAQVRLGTAERPVTLRAGAWTDPDHDGIRGIDSDQVHAALGAGTVLAGSWDLDGAVRFSDTVTEGMVAVGYRF